MKWESFGRGRRSVGSLLGGCSINIVVWVGLFCWKWVFWVGLIVRLLGLIVGVGRF